MRVSSTENMPNNVGYQSALSRHSKPSLQKENEENRKRNVANSSAMAIKDYSLMNQDLMDLNDLNLKKPVPPILKKSSEVFTRLYQHNKKSPVNVYTHV